MAEENERLKRAVASKNIPVVTLDNKWHKIWTMIEKPGEVKKQEKALNELLRKQGKINTDSKDIKKLKKKLMDEILSLSDSSNPDDVKKVEENKRLIEECNEKLDKYDEDMGDIPKEIDEINRDIMDVTARLIYDVMHDNEKEIDRLAEWIAGIRVELKKNVVRKQEMEIQNGVMYSYMHDVFGSEVADMMDMKYNPMEKILKLKAIKDEKQAAEKQKLAEKEAMIKEAADKEEAAKQAGESKA
ncbi:MAG: hypothetical protein K5868_08160 [Lachnospiraceae bacterium]|nr:hypothetical protein [Lachnospiraceae bacterium]